MFNHFKAYICVPGKVAPLKHTGKDASAFKFSAEVVFLENILLPPWVNQLKHGLTKIVVRIKGEIMSKV